MSIESIYNVCIRSAKTRIERGEAQQLWEDSDYLLVTDPVLQEAIMLSTAEMPKQESRVETVRETAVRMLDKQLDWELIAEVPGLFLEQSSALSQDNEQTGGTAK